MQCVYNQFLVANNYNYVFMQIQKSCMQSECNRTLILIYSSNENGGQRKCRIWCTIDQEQHIL